MESRKLVKFDEALSVERIKLLVELASLRLHGVYIELTLDNRSALGFAMESFASVQLLRWASQAGCRNPWFKNAPRSYQCVWIERYDWGTLEPASDNTWVVSVFERALREAYQTKQDHNWQYVQDEVDNLRYLAQNSAKQG